MRNTAAILLLLQFLALSQVVAQRLIVKIDDTAVNHNTVMSNYPHYFQVDVLDDQGAYSIVEGSVSLIRNGKRIATHSLAGGGRALKPFAPDLYPGSRMLIEIREILDRSKNTKISRNLSKAIVFENDLVWGPHPKYRLMVNGDASLPLSGIDPGKLEKVEFEIDDAYVPEDVSIYHVRGVRPLKVMEFSGIEAAAFGLHEMLKGPDVKSGDRMVIELKGKNGAVMNAHVKF